MALIGGEYKVYVAKSGLKLVDNGDDLHSLTDNNDVDSDPYARAKPDRFKIVDKFNN